MFACTLLAALAWAFCLCKAMTKLQGEVTAVKLNCNYTACVCIYMNVFVFISELCMECSVFTWLGAGSQEVHNVEMRSKMSHDLQLRHQGLFLTGACRGWKRAEHPWLSHMIKPANWTSQPAMRSAVDLLHLNSINRCCISLWNSVLIIQYIILNLLSKTTSTKFSASGIKQAVRWDYIYIF